MSDIERVSGGRLPNQVGAELLEPTVQCRLHQRDDLGPVQRFDVEPLEIAVLPQRGDRLGYRLPAARAVATIRTVPSMASWCSRVADRWSARWMSSTPITEYLCCLIASNALANRAIGSVGIEVPSRWANTPRERRGPNRSRHPVGAAPGERRSPSGPGWSCRHPGRPAAGHRTIRVSRRGRRERLRIRYGAPVSAMLAAPQPEPTPTTPDARPSAQRGDSGSRTTGAASPPVVRT